MPFRIDHPAWPGPVSGVRWIAYHLSEALIEAAIAVQDAGHALQDAVLYWRYPADLADQADLEEWRHQADM